MKLEDLLKAVIDGNYPAGFKLYKGLCCNVIFLCCERDYERLTYAIRALYKETTCPVAGDYEYINSRESGDMYESGLRAKFAARVLQYLQDPSAPIKKKKTEVSFWFLKRFLTRATYWS